MAKIIAFANQKGGIGKTTSAINTAAALGLEGKRVLLIDFDPQGNTSSGVGVNKRVLPTSAYDVIIARANAEQAIMKTNFKGLSLLPSNMNLAGAEFELVSADNREYRLRDALKPIEDDYEYMIIDCPPSLGILTLNALAASDGVVVPMQCEYFALEGLSQLVSTIRQAQSLRRTSSRRRVLRACT